MFGRHEGLLKTTIDGKIQENIALGHSINWIYLIGLYIMLGNNFGTNLSAYWWPLEKDKNKRFINYLRNFTSYKH